jgi:hypothetical protein
MKKIFQKTEVFFHGYIPSQALGLYRIGFGLLLWSESMSWYPYAKELFSSDGFHVYRSYSYAFPPWAAVLLCAILVFSSLFMALGLYTRSSTLITWIAWTLLYQVDSLNEKAIHTMIIIVLPFMVFSDCGSVFSLDCYFGKTPKDKIWAFPQRLLQLFFAQVYFFSGLTKLMVPEWAQGLVLQRSINGRWANDWGIWLSGALPESVFRLGGICTVLMEISAPLFLFREGASRVFFIAVCFLFHLGIETTMNIGYLGLHFMIAIPLLFLDPVWVAKTCTSLQTWVMGLPLARRELSKLLK